MKENQIEAVEASLELDENIQLQQKAWLLQKILIGLVLLFIVLALLGLFGNGVLSAKTVEANGTTIKYDKYLRYQGDAKVVFEQSADSLLQIRVPNTFLEAFKIEHIVPEPDAATSGGSQVSYTFKGNPPFSITLYLSPESVGINRATLTAGQTQFHLTQITYP